MYSIILPSSRYFQNIPQYLHNSHFERETKTIQNILINVFLGQVQSMSLTQYLHTQYTNMEPVMKYKKRT